MATVAGDLLETITEGAAMAVLVIDEFTDKVPAHTLNPQIAVLNKALLSNVPIIFVEIKQGDNHVPTHTQLRQAASGARCEVVTKAGINSFHNSRLAEVIEAFNATTLVVMGQHVNMCVKKTVIGGEEPGTGKQTLEGAIQRGYKVLSSNLIVWPQEAKWQVKFPTTQLAFYTKVGTHKFAPVVPKKPPPKPQETGKLVPGQNENLG